MTEKGFQQLEDNFTKKLAQSAEFEKDVIYFEGIKKIQEEMQKIILKRPRTKIVVFIDDLDRCSPGKALEVFESVKVFFDMAGFIFIMGLSQEALNTIIRAKFQNMGLSSITPDQYICKIIQVEVQIPKWTASTIKKLIKERIAPKLEPNLGCIVNESTELILHNVLEGDDPGVGNPREVKRFINKFIIFLRATQTIESLKDYKKYLVVQAMHKKWKIFYDNFFDEKLEYLRERTSKLDSLDSKITFSERVKEWLVLKDHEKETYLRLILQKRSGPYLFPSEDDAKNFCEERRSWELNTAQRSVMSLFWETLFWEKWDQDDLLIEDYKRSQLHNLLKLDLSKKSLLFDYEPFWREVIAMKMEFTDKNGKPSRLQLEDEPMSQDRIADYDRPTQGTISFGERFSLFVPQLPGIYKDVQSATLYVNDDVFNENDYLQTDIERVDVRDTRLFLLGEISQRSPWRRRPRCIG